MACFSINKSSIWVKKKVFNKHFTQIIEENIVRTKILQASIEKTEVTIIMKKIIKL